MNYNFNLFFFSYKPEYIWSDMNGLGHFGTPLLWYNLFWTAFGLFLVLFFSLTFSRGADVSFKKRLSKAKTKLLTAPAFTSYGFLFAALILGGLIFHTVVYTNPYLTEKDQEKRQADYEKQLKHYQFIPQPKIVEVNVHADIFPKERHAYSLATVVLVNKTDKAIDSLHLLSADLSYFHAIYKGDTLKYRYPLKYDKPKLQWFGSENSNFPPSST